MRKILNLLIVMPFLALIASGCSRNSVLPLNDEVLTYQLPYDLTYLRTIEAIQQHKDWDLDWTDREKGLISIRNMRFSSWADADKRQAFLVVKRVNKNETAVYFDPASQAVVGGEEILTLIRDQLTREVSVRGSH